jgi:hypothetical protein
MSDSLIQPFRRNLKAKVIIGPAELTAVPTRVPPMNGQGVTSFLVINPNPFWIWFAGWKGAPTDMPAILENGHYLAPGEKYVGRTQMPDYVAACADEEVGFPIKDSGGNWLYTGKRTRFVLIYGSGA